MGINQGVAYQNTVFIVSEHHFFLYHHPTDTVKRSRNLAAVEFADILMSIRTVVVTLIPMQTKIELGTMLNYRGIKRGQQDMVLVVKSGYRNHKQTMIFTRVAIHNRRTRVCPRAVGTQQLACQCLLQVGHHGLFKSKITHIYIYSKTINFTFIENQLHDCWLCMFSFLISPA